MATGGKAGANCASNKIEANIHPEKFARGLTRLTKEMAGVGHPIPAAEKAGARIAGWFKADQEKELAFRAGCPECSECDVACAVCKRQLRRARAYAVPTAYWE